jgi:ribonuclease BN (tRNA processing enzyme)
VKHGTWKEAYGYKFETRDRKIVISGDTAPTDEVVKACDGCDVLLHEVFNPHGDELKEGHWREYFRTFHTSPAELGEIARRARPKPCGVSPVAGEIAGGGSGGADSEGIFGQVGVG